MTGPLARLHQPESCNSAAPTPSLSLQTAAPAPTPTPSLTRSAPPPWAASFLLLLLLLLLLLSPPASVWPRADGPGLADGRSGAERRWAEGRPPRGAGRERIFQVPPVKGRRRRQWRAREKAASGPLLGFFLLLVALLRSRALHFSSPSVRATVQGVWGEKSAASERPTASPTRRERRNPLELLPRVPRGTVAGPKRPMEAKSTTRQLLVGGPQSALCGLIWIPPAATLRPLTHAPTARSLSSTP